MRRSTALVAVAAPVVLAACGGGARQDANEPSGQFPVQVLDASFPGHQRLAEHSQLVLNIRNSGSQAIPNIAVTILNPKDGTNAQAFAQDIPGNSEPDLASRSRPVWIIDQPPGPCEYSCKQGGPGSAVTAYSNTWALGKLAAGASVKFVWGVTAVQSGNYQVKYEVAAGLNGKAHAVDAHGGQPTGTFNVSVSQAPQSAYVNNAGAVVSNQ